MPLIGDCLVIVLGLMILIFSFQKLWVFQPATQLKIRQANKVIGTYDLNQSRDLYIHGPLGDTHININNGKVRFKQSPCHHQYCVHQGWLSRQGQVAICLPNQSSLELIGTTKVYDSLNY